MERLEVPFIMFGKADATPFTSPREAQKKLLIKKKQLVMFPRNQKAQTYGVASDFYKVLTLETPSKKRLSTAMMHLYLQQKKKFIKFFFFF